MKHYQTIEKKQRVNKIQMVQVINLATAIMPITI